MTIADELQRTFPDRFRVLILDNEVTVDAFVADPPMPWARLTAAGRGYRVAGGYPTILTSEQADREELNWDKVSMAALRMELAALGEGIDLIAFGNNAAQGMPLAAALPQTLRDRGAVIYGRSLPERAQYEALGYARFCARTALLGQIAEASRADGRAPALAFINTIEHNERNYHAPWNG